MTFAFLDWPVPTDGFRWISVDNPNGRRPEPYLTTGLGQFQQYGARTYNPLGEPGLFKTFCETDPTPEAILAFANLYGQLGGKMIEQIVQTDSSGASAR